MGYDDPKNMTSEAIVGVRIGLRLAVELIDRERVKVLADGTSKKTKRPNVMAKLKAASLDDLGTRIFAIRDQYEPPARPQPPGAGAADER